MHIQPNDHAHSSILIHVRDAYSRVPYTRFEKVIKKGSIVIADLESREK